MTDKEKIELRIVKENASIPDQGSKVRSAVDSQANGYQGKTIKAFETALKELQATRGKRDDELTEGMKQEWAWYDANKEDIDNIQNDPETMVSPQTHRRFPFQLTSVKRLVDDEITESHRHVDLMVEKRAQIYQQEIELIEKAIADLTLSMTKLEEENIDSSPVEELVELMKAKYGPESKYGKFLTGAVKGLL